MGVADRFADLQEQPDPLLHGQAAGVAVVGDRDTFHVLQRQVRLAFAADSGVEQPCDVGVRQARQDFALAAEAKSQVGIGEAGPQQLERHLPLVQSVGARGQPDHAHAAFAKDGIHAVGSDSLAHRRQFSGIVQGSVDPRVIHFLQCQQPAQVGGKLRILATQRFQPRRLRWRIQLE